MSLPLRLPPADCFAGAAMQEHLRPDVSPCCCSPLVRLVQRLTRCCDTAPELACLELACMLTWHRQAVTVASCATASHPRAISVR